MNVPIKLEHGNDRLILANWREEDTQGIYRLETVNWAPWLRKPEACIRRIAVSYPQIQLLIKDQKGLVIATLSSNRINWNGDPKTLTSWDEVAGGSEKTSDYQTTYNPNGNTLCLMSISVDPEHKGKRLASKLIEALAQIANENNIEHISSSIRPSSYGEYKLTHGPLPISEYIQLKRQVDGLPVDTWLRIGYRHNLKLLRIYDRAMNAEVPLSTFETYKREYQPHKWKEVEKGKWECGEAGNWFIKKEKAEYTESNIWCEIPIST